MAGRTKANGRCLGAKNMNHLSLLVIALYLFVTSIAVVKAEDSESSRNPYEALVPQYLLGLAHAPEVHQELELTEAQVQGLESLFHEIDNVWFPARLLPQASQRKTVHELEQKLLHWFDENTSDEQRKRLGQLEYYSQSSRILLREDVRSRVGLEASQQSKLAVLARATDDAQQKLSQIQFGDPDAKGLQSKFNDAYKAERGALTKLVTNDQRLKLNDLLGPTFDPSKLSRIYAMAPEFNTVEHWINSEPLTMSELKGKVVIVHFYAFECHNCHANFAIYQRWYKELTSKGVVIVGIQTPETDRERNPDAVKSAASQREFRFPIVVDLESKNWRSWGNTMWPTVYIVDKNGYIRHWWQGELNWNGATADKTIDQLVAELLAEKI